MPVIVSFVLHMLTTMKTCFILVRESVVQVSTTLCKVVVGKVLREDGDSKLVREIMVELQVCMVSSLLGRLKGTTETVRIC